MPTDICLVATTIGDGTFLDDYSKALQQEHLQDVTEIIIIPDLKTNPRIFDKCAEIARQGLKITCPTVEQQDQYLAKIGPVRNIIPYNSDNRRNIGFLMALEKNFKVLVSVDDDNFPQPEDNIFKSHLITNSRVEMEAVHSSSGWFNICDLMEVEPRTTYPRGFPYRHRHKNPDITYTGENGTVHVNAGLWLGHPDIDAVSCLYAPAKSSVFKGKSVLLGKQTWSPINTQNTAITGEAIAAYYFARMGYPLAGLNIDRDGDIFSGYFLQACVRHLGFRIRVGTPVAKHIRNSHNYLKDLTYELACIWMFEDITEWLHELKLQGSSYGEVYLCLADMLDQQAEKFSGFIWNDSAKGYIHYLAYCMRTWMQAVKSIRGG